MQIIMLIKNCTLEKIKTLQFVMTIEIENMTYPIIKAPTSLPSEVRLDIEKIANPLTTND